MRDVTLLHTYEMSQEEHERFRDEWIEDYAKSWARETDMPADYEHASIRFEEYMGQEGYSARNELLRQRRHTLLMGFISKKDHHTIRIVIDDPEDLDDSLGELVQVESFNEDSPKYGLYLPNGEFIRACDIDGKDLPRPDDYDTSHLKSEGLKAAEAILAVMRKHGEPHSGGCKCFYTPEEWEARGEEYGVNSVLIVCHDGGTQAQFFNWDYMDYAKIDEVCVALKPLGLFAEQCTSWYSAVHAL